MGVKELTKDLGEKAVERYKKISKAFSIPRSTVKFIIKKWKVFCTTKTLPGSGCHYHLDGRARLYGKEWPLCACDNNITTALQICLLQEKRNPWRFWGQVEKGTMARWDQNRTFWPPSQTVWLVESQYSSPFKEHHAYRTVRHGGGSIMLGGEQ